MAFVSFHGNAEVTAHLCGWIEVTDCGLWPEVVTTTIDCIKKNNPVVNIIFKVKSNIKIINSFVEQYVVVFPIGFSTIFIVAS